MVRSWYFKCFQQACDFLLTDGIRIAYNALRSLVRVEKHETCMNNERPWNLMSGRRLTTRKHHLFAILIMRYPLWNPKCLL